MNWPSSDRLRSGPKRVNDLARNHFLLLTQVVPEQLVAIDVSGVHADHRMVHQQVDVEIGDADSLGDRTVGLPKVVSPFRKGRPILLVLDQVSAFAVSREKPLRR